MPQNRVGEKKKIQMKWSEKISEMVQKAPGGAEEYSQETGNAVLTQPERKKILRQRNLAKLIL